MSVPAVNSGALAAMVPAALGGPSHLTVGLLAAFIAVSCIIAADTGAYFCGKSFGRTKVSSVVGGRVGVGGGARQASLCSRQACLPPPHFALTATLLWPHLPLLNS